MADTFPQRKARTRNFTLGAPRDFKVAADGSRIAFLRSPAGDDPLTALWVYDVGKGEERLITDPRALIPDIGSGERLSHREQAQRERKRETAAGIVAYAIDQDAQLATFVLAGALWVADLGAATTHKLTAPEPVLDPRLDNRGNNVAFIHDRDLYVVGSVDGVARRLVGEDEETVTWGLAEFLAEEEMGRHRGYWWAPDGDSLLVARVDEAPVARWWISDPGNPRFRPQEVRYPAAGTANANVSLHLVSLRSGQSVEVRWERGVYPYLLTAHWDEHGPFASVQTRDHRRVVVLAIDAHSGATTIINEQCDQAWLEPVDGVPRRLADGRFVTVGTAGDASSLIVAGSPVTPQDLQVRIVIDVRDEQVVFTASSEPSEIHVWRWSATDGLSQLTTVPGVHTAVIGGNTLVLGSSTMDDDGVRWTTGSHVFRSEAEKPVVTPAVRLMAVGPLRVRVGVVFPRDYEPGRPLPVLMDPYGGPGHQRVLAARQLWREPQWLADQGFAVVVADGRGTPGRGHSWSRAIYKDLAGPPLEDQILALSEVADTHPDLDITRVAIRGWSFGGYLAAMAVLRHPDIFHAAIAGAAVTDWRLYDTYYSERYLGTNPQGADHTAYDHSSVLQEPMTMPRPLLLIHGLADDNVVAAHTLLLSRRLVESSFPHSVLPLPSVTHMAPQVAIAKNLLLLQVDFLRRALDVGN